MLHVWAQSPQEPLTCGVGIRIGLSLHGVLSHASYLRKGEGWHNEAVAYLGQGGGVFARHAPGMLLMYQVSQL